jgi:hypothetical protein
VAVKNNVEYYQHDTDAHNHAKFKTLRARYGWEGEGRFWALNNMIGKAENCFLDLEKKYNLTAAASDLGMSVEELRAFVDFLAEECALVTVTDHGITTERVQETLERVSQERERNRGRVAGYRARQSVQGGSNGGVTRDNRVTTDAVQIERKVKKSKVKEIYAGEFESWYGGYPRKVSKTPAAKAFAALREAGIPLEDLTRARDHYIAKLRRFGTDEQHTLHPSTFLHEDRWRDYLAAPTAGGPPPAPPRPPCPVCGWRPSGTMQTCPTCGLMVRHFDDEVKIAEARSEYERQRA